MVDVTVPTPGIDHLAWMVFGMLIALPAPYYFAVERLQGFTRAMFLKLPYEPPPGKEEEEAMEEATEQQE